MPDPFIGAAALAKVASSATSNAVAPSLLKRVLGPAADEIGQALVRWTSFRVGNVKRITERQTPRVAYLGATGLSIPVSRTPCPKQDRSAMTS